MKEWLCIPADTVNQALLGAEFESLDLGFTCGGVSPNIPGDGETLSHIVTYDGGQTFININNPETTHVDITLFNIGRRSHYRCKRICRNQIKYRSICI